MTQAGRDAVTDHPPEVTTETETRSHRTVFSEVYRHNRWGFGSGAGSLPNVTVPYRALLETFIKTHAISSIVDFGCGDWQFSRLVDWGNASYTGYDIVPDVITRVAARHTSRTSRFYVAPEDPRDLPAADLLIVKDVLQHWPNTNVLSFLAAIKGKYRHTLVTNCSAPDHLVNTDIAIGGWRPIDLSRAPFCQPTTHLLSFSGIAPAPIDAPWRKATVTLA